jgi:hypothetical protein
MIDYASFESDMREWIGETIGRFALGEPSITQDQLIEAVDVELAIGAETVEGLLSPGNWRLAELFCTP